ncbi:hypothetical protein [Maricaulis sp. CAU 1757]
MPGNRRYFIHFGTAMAVYVITILGSVFLIKQTGMEGWPAGLVALTPLVPALYALHAYVVRFRELDEYQRRVISEAILWAAGLIGFGTFGYGFLQGVGVVPPLDPTWILPTLIGLYGLISAIRLRCFT